MLDEPLMCTQLMNIEQRHICATYAVLLSSAQRYQAMQQSKQLPTHHSVTVSVSQHAPAQSQLTLHPSCLQAQCPDVRLWVACMHLDYQGIMAAMMQETPGTSYEQVGTGMCCRLVVTVADKECRKFSAAAPAAAATAGVQWGNIHHGNSEQRQPRQIKVQMSRLQWRPVESMPRTC
jgi:hypothetical protein